MSTEPSEPAPPPPRPPVARFILAGMPIVLAGVLIVAVGVLFATSWVGGEPKGEKAAISWSSDCAEQWEPIARKRAESVGFGELQVSREGARVTVVGVMPGLPDDRDAMPRLLTGQGNFAAYAAQSKEEVPSGEPLATTVDITDVFLAVDYSGQPYMQLTLQPHALERLQSAGPVLIFTMDGAVVDYYDAARPIKEDEVRLQPKLETVKEEVRVATDWSILVRHGAAPCPVRELTLVPAT